MHGGATQLSRAAAGRRIIEAEAARNVSKWGARPDIHPAEALLELVQSKAAEVAYWQAQVAGLDDAALTYGQTLDSEGWSQGDSTSETRREARPAVALTLLHRAQDQLAAYATAALKAGVDERLVQIAQQQASGFVALLQAVLEPLGLTPAQQALVPAAIEQAITTREATN